MSVATPTADVQPTESVISKVDQVINERVGEAAAALWRAELLRASLQLFTAVVTGVVVWAIMDQWIYSPGQLFRSLALVGGAVAVLAYVFGRLVPLFRTPVSSEYAARSLERDLPELRQGLLSYIMLRGDITASNSSSGGLHSGIVRSLGAQTAGRLKSFDQLPSEATGTMKWWLAAIASIVCLLGYAALSPKDTLQSTKRLLSPLASIAAPRRVSIDDVTPGDAEALAGQAIDVSAEIRGLGRDEVPTIVWRSATPSASKTQQTELQFDKDTRRYRGSIQLDYTSHGDMQYELLAGDATAGPYRLTIQDVPVIVDISVHYAPPSYTGEKPYTRTGGGITALSGSTVTVTATTNRPVKRAKIEFNPRTLGESVQATAGSREMQVNEAGTRITLAMPLKSVRGRAAAVELENYRIQVWDDAGQSSPNPIVYPIRVIEDLAPDVTIVVPRQSPKDVPIDSQQMIEVHAIDPDYGLKTIELELRRGIDVLANPVLWRDDRGASGNQVAEYRFRPSEHGLRVGDVVSVTAVASDNLSSDDDPSIEPNFSSADAIEFKITMGEAPAGEPQLNDGLSKKDDSPAADTGEKNQSGEQGGGGGAGGKGDAPSTAKGDSGGQSQAGNSSSDGEGKQDDQRKSEGGASGSNSTDKEPSKDGEASGANSPSKSDPSDTANSGSSPQNGSSENMSSPNGNQPNNSANPSDGADQSNGAEQSKGAEQSDSTEQKNGAGKAGNSQSAAGDKSQPNNTESEGGSEDSGDSSGEQPSDEKRSPEHDGEAFERIREHLNQKKAAQENQSQENASKADTNQSKSGEPSANKPEPRTPQGDSQSGENSKQPDSKSSSSGQTKGDQNKGKPANGEQGKGEQAKGEPVQGEENKGAPSTGESGQQPGAGKPNDNMSKEDKPPADSKSASGDDLRPDKKTSDQNAGDQNAGDQNGGDNKAGADSGEAPQPSNDQPGDGAETEPQKDSTTSDTERKSNESKGDSSDSGLPTSKPQANSSKNGKSKDQTDSNQPQSSGEGGAGTGTGAETGSASGAPETPVDAPDLEYTKKATDMVLDYLKETRDAPDRELLEKLKWSEDDLRRFSERWQSLRESSETSPLGENREMKEALESLGMRPKSSVTTNRRLEQDDLQGLRDSGARQAPPAALRDAFDAFRRATPRQKP